MAFFLRGKHASVQMILFVLFCDRIFLQGDTTICNSRSSIASMFDFLFLVKISCFLAALKHLIRSPFREISLRNFCNTFASICPLAVKTPPNNLLFSTISSHHSNVVTDEQMMSMTSQMLQQVLFGLKYKSSSLTDVC